MDEEEVLANGSQLYNYKSWMQPSDLKIKSLWEWHSPEDTPLRISVSGAAGTGKRKLAKTLARRLDITDITGIPRTMKDLGAQLSKSADMEDEFMMFLAQVWEEREYDEFVTAGSLIDLVAHMDYLAQQSGDQKHKRLVDGMANVVNMLSNNTYSVLFYLPFRNKPKADGVRSVDVRYLREIDRLIHFYLDAFDLDYLPLDGTPSENAKTALRYMEDFDLLSDRD